MCCNHKSRTVETEMHLHVVHDETSSAARRARVCVCVREGETKSTANGAHQYSPYKRIIHVFVVPSALAPRMHSFIRCGWTCGTTTMYVLTRFVCKMGNWMANKRIHDSRSSQTYDWQCMHWHLPQILCVLTHRPNPTNCRCPAWMLSKGDCSTQTHTECRLYHAITNHIHLFGFVRTSHGHAAAMRHCVEDCRMEYTWMGWKTKKISNPNFSVESPINDSLCNVVYRLSLRVMFPCIDIFRVCVLCDARPCKQFRAHTHTRAHHACFPFIDEKVNGIVEAAIIHNTGDWRGKSAYTYISVPKMLSVQKTRHFSHSTLTFLPRYANTHTHTYSYSVLPCFPFHFECLSSAAPHSRNLIWKIEKSRWYTI